MMIGDVHSRRLKLVYSPYTSDNLEYDYIKGYEYIGIFEKKYGIPTDIDAVWKDRERHMNILNSKLSKKNG
jgi:hypothetical protein